LQGGNRFAKSGFMAATEVGCRFFEMTFSVKKYIDDYSQ